MISIDRTMELVNKKAEKLIYHLSQGWDTLRSMTFQGDEIVFVYGYDGMGRTTNTILVNAEIFFNENIETIVRSII
jgi:hypothetical protein